jgi:hypothetical protein
MRKFTAPAMTLLFTIGIVVSAIGMILDSTNWRYHGAMIVLFTIGTYVIDIWDKVCND